MVVVICTKVTNNITNDADKLKMHILPDQLADSPAYISKQLSIVADEPTQCAASLQMCCKQRWMLSVINLRLN